MQKGDECFDSRFLETVQQVDVVVDCGLAEFALNRFDAAPGNREAVCLMPESFEQLDVLFVEAVAVARFPGFGDAGIVHLLMPFARVDVVALDLVGGCGGAPEEPLREFDFGIGECVEHGLSLLFCVFGGDCDDCRNRAGFERDDVK